MALRVASSILVQLCLALSLGLHAGAAVAELESLSDDELSEVDGAGIGLVFEDFILNAGEATEGGGTFRITGIESSDGESVAVTVSQLFIARAGSNFGQNLQPVNLGRLNNPFNIGLVDGDDIGLPNQAVLEIAAPELVDPSVGFDCLNGAAGAGSGPCSSRPAFPGFDNGERPDLGLQLDVQVGANTPDSLNINAQSAVIDGSFIRLFGDDERQQLAGQFNINFFSPSFSVDTCDIAGACSSIATFTDFELQFRLGNEIQPVFLDVTGDGNFVFELRSIPAPAPGTIAADGTATGSDPATFAFYEDYYTDPRFRSNLRVGNLNVNGTDFGSSEISGLLIQYLRIESRDLSIPR